MLTDQFYCRSTLAQSDSFQSPDFFNDGFCVHGLALLRPGITVFAFLSCVSELADCPTQLKTLSRPSDNRIGKLAERRANLSSLITFHVKNLENIKGGSVDVVPKEKRLVHRVKFTPYKQTISSNVILANRRVIHCVDGAPEKTLGKRISHLVGKEDIRCGKEFETGLVGLVTHVEIDLIDEKRFVKSSEQERLENVNYVAACDHAKSRVPVPPPDLANTFTFRRIILYCLRNSRRSNAENRRPIQ